MRNLRVLDLSTTIPGAYCSRLLATSGADVVVAEPPGGSPLRLAPPSLGAGRSAAWEYLQAYKRGIVADPCADSTIGLAGEFDLVVLSSNSDAEAVAARAARFRGAHPKLVVTAVSGFGLTGSYRAWRTSGLVDWAIGGHMSLNGEPDRAPLAGGGPWVSYVVGATAAVGSQAALLRAKRTGEGDVVDVGGMEAIAAAHQWSMLIYTHQGIVKRRWGNRHGESFHPLSLHPCADGWVCIAAVSPNQWEGLCIAMDQVELLIDESLYSPASRFDRADELDVLINGWTASHTTADVVEALQANRCPAGRVATLTETLADEHLAYRGFWATPEHLGPNAAMPSLPFQIGSVRPVFRRAPELGEHQAEVAA